MKRPRLKMRLGDLLVHEQIITEDQLHKALEEQHLSGRKLGATLTDLGYISEQQLLEFLAQQLKLPLISISERKSHRRLSSYCLRFRLAGIALWSLKPMTRKPWLA